MKFDFLGQEVVITGGLKGIGFAITKEFLKNRAKVIATYSRETPEIDQALEELAEWKGSLTLMKLNLQSSESIQQFFLHLESIPRKIQVFINNAGIHSDALGVLMNIEKQWRPVIETNLTGTFEVCQQAIKHLLPQRYGRIINISSISQRLTLQGQSNYAASKAGLFAFSQCLSKEVAKKGITVNVVAPGFIQTKMVDSLSDEQKTTYKKQIPMKKFGTPQNVATSVLFLASKESSYITGVSLDVAGGL